MLTTLWGLWSPFLHHSLTLSQKNEKKKKRILPLLFSYDFLGHNFCLSSLIPCEASNYISSYH